ncbi:MAG: adenylyl-sulfate kinase, partial [Planctomycetota bacterium]
AKVIGEERFIVVHVATPLEVCRERDTKGQYAKADAGELLNFPGVTADYEAPAQPDVIVDASTQSIDECVDAIIATLRARDCIK